MTRFICLLLILCFLSISNKAFSNSHQPPQKVTLQDFVKLAKEGSQEAQYLIGYSVLFDQEVSGEKYADKEQALIWLDTSIKANPFYGWFVGREFSNQDKPVLAQIYFQKAINAGYHEAFSDLATLYLGEEHSKASNLLAKRYFEAAASHGNSYAYIHIGHIYQNGWGVEQDLVKAEQYFQKAISLGETAGYTALGEMKERHFQNPDYKEILDLYLKDAQNGGSTGILGIKRLYKKYNQFVGLKAKEVLYWHYVYLYRDIYQFGKNASALDEATEFDDGLTSFQITEIKKKAEALVKDFSN